MPGCRVEPGLDKGYLHDRFRCHAALAICSQGENSGGGQYHDAGFTDVAVSLRDTGVNR